MRDSRIQIAVWAVLVTVGSAACQGQSGQTGVKRAPKRKIADAGATVSSRAASVYEIAGEANVKFDPATPTPESVLGFQIGSRAIRHLEVKQYLSKLAEASDRVELRQYGTTHEGRELIYAIISDPANMKRLDAIRGDLGKLADPRTTDDAEARRIIDKSPAVAWMLYTVHGDEMSGTDAAVAAAYRLAAARDPATLDLLKSVVVCIDPLQNPDGRERFLALLQQYSGKIPTGDGQSIEHWTPWPAGRTNHYLFDLNRDWYVAVHPESRGRVETIAGWHPQLLVDGHEMGSSSTYLFSPPTDPINLHIPPNIMKWFEKYTSDQADAFDRHGWSYYRGEWNEAWAIGFADVWGMHHGAAGILYEQARSHGSFVRLPTDQDRYYREDVAHHLTSTMANLRTLAANRRAFLADFYEDKKAAVADARAKGSRDLFCFVPGDNRTRAAEFLEMLQRQRIEAYRVPTDATVVLKDVETVYGETVAEKKLPGGTIVISMKQPLGPMARAMLEFDPHMTDDFLAVERRELELNADTKFYDLTGWCLAMAYGVESYWGRGDLSSLSPNLEPALLAAVRAGSSAGVAALDAARPAYGYVIDGNDDAAVALVGRMLQDGWRIRAGNKPFVHAGRSFPAGSFLIRGHENPDRLASFPKAAAGLPPGLAVVARSARSERGPDLGGEEFPLLVEPRIALIGNAPMSAYSYGAIWHLLDARIGLRISRLQAHRLGSYDLRKYNVIVLPNGGGLAGVLGDGVRKRLKTWMRDGGTLVAVERAAAFLCDEDRKFSSVRLRRDVLKDLDIYAEAVWREGRADAPPVAPGQVWDFDKARGFTTTRPADRTIKTDDADALKRYDAWARRFMPHGVILRANTYPEHWLAHGVGAGLPVVYGAGHVLMARSPIETAVRLSDAESLRLSGLLWPEARERLTHGAYLTRESFGRGQLILFAADPTFRGFVRGAERLFLNAVILGPGLGASATTPW